MSNLRYPKNSLFIAENKEDLQQFLRFIALLKKKVKERDGISGNK